jgi:hypothetical protein
MNASSSSTTKTVFPSLRDFPVVKTDRVTFEEAEEEEADDIVVIPT